MSTLSISESSYLTPWQELPCWDSLTVTKLIEETISLSRADNSTHLTELSWKNKCKINLPDTENCKIASALRFLVLVSQSKIPSKLPAPGSCKTYLGFIDSHFNILILLFEKLLENQSKITTPPERENLLSLLTEIASLPETTEIWIHRLTEEEKLIYENLLRNHPLPASTDENSTFLSCFLKNWEDGKAYHRVYKDKESDKNRWEVRSPERLYHIVSGVLILQKAVEINILKEINERLTKVSKLAQKRLAHLGLILLSTPINRYFMRTIDLERYQAAQKFLTLVEPITKEEENLKIYIETLFVILNDLGNFKTYTYSVKKTINPLYKSQALFHRCFEMKKSSSDHRVLSAIKAPPLPRDLRASQSQERLGGREKHYSIFELNTITAPEYVTTINELIGDSLLAVPISEVMFGKGPAIEQHIKKFHQLCNYVALTILQADSSYTAHKKIDLWINVACELKKRGNLEAHFAIYSGVNLHSVNRLSKVLEALHEDFHPTFCTNEGFLKQRTSTYSKIASTKEGLLPISVFTRQHTTIGLEGNPQEKIDRDHVNLDLLDVVGACANLTIRSQMLWESSENRHHELKPRPYLKKQILSINLNDEKDLERHLDQMSEKIHPIGSELYWGNPIHIEGQKSPKKSRLKSLVSERRLPRMG